MLGTVAEILRRRLSEGWLVGGNVRDRELGRYSADLDVAVADDAAAVARELAKELRAPWFALSERHPTYRVLGPEGYVDVAAVRGGGILADLALRDFTVNAMAAPIGARADGGPVIDPFGGLAHLREGRLVAVSERVFVDDPLRLMRAPRFLHTLGLRLDDGLVRAIREQAPALASAAAERVVAEMSITLAAGRAADAARLWHDLGLLSVVLPELAAADGSAANRAAADGVIEDRLFPALALLERLDDLLASPSTWFPATAQLLDERLAQPVDGALDRPVALRLAGLMHGLTVEEAQTAGRRLRLSSPMVSLLCAVSRHPCVGAGLLPQEKAVTREAVLFLWNATPWEPEVILVAAAAAGDGAGALEPARRMMSLYAGRASGGQPQFPLDGEMLMHDLGLESGPLVGRALREARLAWEAGEAATAGEALTVARNALTKD